MEDKGSVIPECLYFHLISPMTILVDKGSSETFLWKRFDSLFQCTKQIRQLWDKTILRLSIIRDLSSRRIVATLDS